MKSLCSPVGLPSLLTGVLCLQEAAVWWGLVGQLTGVPLPGSATNSVITHHFFPVYHQYLSIECLILSRSISLLME